jgi:recombination protein RecA
MLKKIKRRNNTLAKKEELTKEQKLDQLIKKVNEDFGNGTIITNETLPEIKRFSSGSFSLDKALGGGWACGRIIELMGNESSAKTTLALHAVAEMQKIGGTCAYLDQEHALDGSYAKALGVDLKQLLIAQPFCGEDCLEITDELSGSGLVDLVIIDSVAALVPRAELEGQMSDQQMGLQARLMSKAMRMMTGPAAKNGTTIMFINQFRSKINMYGGGKTTTGGNALKFYASQRVELYRPNKPIEKAGQPIGIQVEANVIKNKVAPPFQKASLFVKWGQGVDKYTDVLRASVEKGLIDKGGAWYTYKDQKIQGEDNMAEAIKDNDWYEELVGELAR